MGWDGEASVKLRFIHARNRMTNWQIDSVVPYMVDVDPEAPIQPRTPFPKWGAAGPGSIDAQLGNRARLTDRIFVKFRDDLKVRVTGDANRPVRSDAPARTITSGGGKIVTTVDPNTELAEALAMPVNTPTRVLLEAVQARALKRRD